MLKHPSPGSEVDPETLAPSPAIHIEKQGADPARARSFCRSNDRLQPSAEHEGAPSDLAQDASHEYAATLAEENVRLTESAANSNR